MVRDPPRIGVLHDRSSIWWAMSDVQQQELGKTMIDCWGTDEIVCPYCGESFGLDSWEVFIDEMTKTATLDCDKCGKTFTCAPEYSVQYYSAKLSANSEREDDHR